MTDAMILQARWVVPVTDGDPVLEQHAVVIDQGRIAAVLPWEEAEQLYPAAPVLRRDQHLVMPGLINAHTHAAMSLFRGLADDLPLMTWLNDHIWPAEHRWAQENFCADGTRLAMAEMLRGGITCFNDMYFFPNATAEAVCASGMRAVLGLIVIDFPSAWAENQDEYFRRGLELHDQFRGHPTLHTAFAPHAPYSVADSALERVVTLAGELGLPVHMHLHETDDEIRMSLDQYGVRPLERLQRLGLLNGSLLAVHMTHLNDAEIDRCASSGLSVVHCPESNLKLASGFCPAQRLLDAGVNLALGSDSAASNNDLDLFGEMRTAALLAKGVAGNAAALPAATALRMATINGARALGLADEIGSLEVGKSADLITVDMGAIESTPIYHPLSQLVYATHRHQVSDVWVAGRQLLDQRRLLTLDEGEILANARVWQGKLADNA